MKSKGKPRRRRAGAAKPKVKSKPLAVRKAPQNERSKVRDLEQRLAESLERETATSEILGVISSSPTDIQPVFNTIMRSAVRLSGARFGAVYRFDGEMVHFAGEHGSDDAALESFRRMFPMRPDRGVLGARTILDRAVVHVPDVFQDPEFLGKDIARASGWNSAIAVPMLREGTPIGAIVISKAERGPFSDGQITLLKTFADQAVIAIENVRLFTELEARNRDLTEGLERETATGEILRVISSSPTDIQPVLEAILDSAKRLCEATFGAVFRFDGEAFVLAASTVISSEFATWLRDHPLRPGPRTPLTRAGLEHRPVQVADILADTDTAPPDIYRREGMRTALAVPMLKDDVLLGALTFHRHAVQPFTDQQIALLETFAAQAVIAIENVRLFTELQARNRDLTQALEQQTATAEVLRVIGSSPTDAQPVFDAIVSSAWRLLGGYGGAVYRVVADQLHLAAYISTNPAGDAALRRTFPRPLSVFSPPGEAIRRGAPVILSDIDTAQWIPDDIRKLIRERGDRSGVWVPMMRDGQALGAIGVTRSGPGAFSDEQIALLRTFADQAVIAIENVRLFTELRASNRELTTALDQQTATSDILRVISQSQTNVQPVFDAIVASAVRLLGGYTGALTRIAGDQIAIGALTGHDAASDAAVRAGFPVSLQSEVPHAQAIRDRVPLNIVDYQADPRLSETLRASAGVRGYRSLVVVPMLRHDEAVGAIGVTRRDVGGFTDDEIALLKTFADQAVIAIENVRLFTELQGRNRDLTATAEILRVISSSPTDVQPVFDTIVRSAVRLCDGLFSALLQFDGELLHQVAQYNFTPEALEAAHSMYPVRPSRGFGAGRAILERAVVNIPDFEVDPEFRYQAVPRAIGWRSGLFVPMLREGTPIGVIMVARAEPGPFSASEVELLKTFADQAVIAVENVRLFTELQASNRGLVAALDQQTATSDILRVISRSQTNVQPVFDAILDSAVRLLRGYSGVVTRLAGDQIELAALTTTDDAGDAATRLAFPQSHQSDGPHAQAMRDRTSINITDAQTDPRVSDGVRANARARGNRSWVIVPLLRHDEAVGTIAVTRREPGGFADEEIALLKTFADQAVIAIENARLLTELQARTQELSRSVGELQALGEVGQAISSTLDLETVLTTIVSHAVQLSALDGGVMFEYDEGTEEFVQRAATDPGGALAEARRTTRIRKGEGVVGQTAITLEPAQVPDIAVPAAYEGRLRETLVESGIRAILAVPMVREGQLIGCLGVTRNLPGEFPTETIELLRTFATQSALAIQNARLFQEIADKSAQLEAASRHKSEFLANMSHELRTPLNAIIGFSEILAEKMFGDINEKQTEYLQDILESGRHLLSLINDILDLSKIEAGRMELELSEFDLPQAIDNALILVRERASRRGITLGHDIDERLGSIRGDERKVKQVLLNLLSNALKFTPEGGRIDVRAVPRNGVAEISVTDTGVGIAPEDQEAVFEEFRQVGTADKKVEGTGLGLALSRKFIELHGGRIWVESEVGKGSTFRFTLPVRS